MSFNRRAVIGSAVAAGASILSSFKVSAKLVGDVELRGSIGRLERLPTRELESMEDFSTKFRRWVAGDLNSAAERWAAAVMKAAKIADANDVPMGRILELLDGDPILMTLTHTWIDGQLLMWRRLQNAFHSDADRYLTEMESADKAGPGSLELNPLMAIPDYTKWEIHMQPGGYVGDPFAGHIYHYGTNNF